ncbi:preprotein translocase subunit SecY, partial [Streptococcus pyogenes]
SYLPLKLNPAGVIPVIFAGSITAIPTSIVQFFASQNQSYSWLTTLQEFFDYTSVKGMIVYALLIILFTFFYTFVQVNPEKTAENLQKSG